jgi:hypothetical protein
MNFEELFINNKEQSIMVDTLPIESIEPIL